MSKRKKKRQIRVSDQEPSGNEDGLRAISDKGESQSDGPLFILVLVLFFASGFSALLYQVVWTKLLVLVFGATTFATATVLASFMGGLALGSLIAGQVSDRLRRPFLCYGVLEAIAGIWALIIPWLIQATLPIYCKMWQQLHLTTVSFGVSQMIIVGLILLVPTTCLGATLPLLSRFVTTATGQTGKRIGTLYAVNTAGAICGAMMAGFVLIPSLGLNCTTVVAALINFLLFLAVLLKRDSALEVVKNTPGLQSKQSERTPVSVLVAMLVFFASGATAMVYEVSWTRNLTFVVGGSTQSFTIMVTVFLLGISLGALFCARFIDQTKHPVSIFAGLEILLAMLTVATLQVFNYLPFWVLSAINTSQAEADITIVKIFLSSLMLLPLTLCLGAIFPAVVRICATRTETVGRSVGRAYAANTAGAIVGSIAAGFALLPCFGVERTLLLSAAVNAALGFALFMSDESLPVKRKTLYAGTSAGLCIVLCLVPPVLDPVILMHAQSASRAIKYGQAFSFADYSTWRTKLHDQYESLYWKDGATCHVGVLHDKVDNQKSIVTSGEIDGGDGGDMPLQLLLAAYPLLLKPDAKDVALIGWGTGVSSGLATLFPIDRLVAVEIEPSVIEATKHFHHVNHEAEKNAKVVLEYNDGRNYLLACPDLYDIIISEPSNPWRAGVCNLYTTEYFGLCKKRLRKGGLFSLWLQTSEVPPEMVKSVLAALGEHFSNALIFIPNPHNVIVVAGDEPILVKPRAVDDLLQESGIAADMKKAGLTTSERMLSQIIVASDGCREMTKGIKPITDDHNDLEYVVGEHYQSQIFAKENVQLFLKYMGSPWNNVDWKGFSKIDKNDYMRFVAAANLRALSGIRIVPLAERWNAEADKEARASEQKE